MTSIYDMRTTLTIDDDIIWQAAEQAKLRGVSLSRNVSDLLRRALNAPLRVEEKEGLFVVELPADSPTVTSNDVGRFEDDDR